MNTRERIRKLLQEGTWSLPTTEDQYESIISAASSLMNNEIDSDEYQSRMYSSLGNDSFFDELDNAQKYQERTGTDQRYAMVVCTLNYIKTLIIDYEKNPNQFSKELYTKRLWDTWERINNIVHPRKVAQKE